MCFPERCSDSAEWAAFAALATLAAPLLYLLSLATLAGLNVPTIMCVAIRPSLLHGLTAATALLQAFSKGFYSALAEGEKVPVATAFDAGRARFLQEGFREGDPEDHLHPPHHPHVYPQRKQQPGWRTCTGCCPPVHGEVVLVASAQMKTPSAKSRSHSGANPWVLRSPQTPEKTIVNTTVAGASRSM